MVEHLKLDQNFRDAIEITDDFSRIFRPLYFLMFLKKWRLEYELWDMTKDEIGRKLFRKIRQVLKIHQSTVFSEQKGGNSQTHSSLS